MVYITSGLFGHDITHGCPNLTASTHPHMHNNADDSQSTTGLGKRKRREDDEKQGPSPKHISMSSPAHDRFGPGSLTSFLRSSPTSEGHIRLHGHNPAPYEGNDGIFSRPSANPHSERRPVKQLKRQNPKPSLAKTPSHLMDTEVDIPSSPPVQRKNTHSSSDLRSCHACGTAPKRKRDLENYMDCRKCNERTCYICARQCSGCQKAICKECIVEVGQEGEPWCLECYQHINT